MITKSIIIYPGGLAEKYVFMIIESKIENMVWFFLIYVGVIYKTTIAKGGE